MLIMATFDYSMELEQALLILEREGIERRGIMVVPLDPQTEHRSSLTEPPVSWTQRSFEAGIAVGTACSVLGISHGFIRAWGPLIWGLIMAFCGFGLGFGVYALLYFKLWRRRRESGKHPEAAVIVRGGPDNEKWIREILWSHNALSIGVIPSQPLPDQAEPSGQNE